MSPSNCRCSLWFSFECGGGHVLGRGRFVIKINCFMGSLNMEWAFVWLRTQYSGVYAPVKAERGTA